MKNNLKGKVTRCQTNGTEKSFDIEVNKVYKVTNCLLCNTAPNVHHEGIECYKGNIEIEEDGVTKPISATLWVKPDNTCICLYEQ